MNESQLRVTLKDVAAAAGVSVMTVSYALRGHPATAERTRERVKRVAEKLGYRPDPGLSALVSHREQKRIKKKKANLALVNWWWDSHQVEQPYYRQVAKGIRKQAEERGYAIEVFSLATAGMTTRRATRILKSRGVQGVIVVGPRLPRMEALLDWEQFSVVAVGRSTKQLKMDFVTANHYENMTLLLQQMETRGYKRVGYVSPAQLDNQIQNRYLGAYLAWQRTAATYSQEIPPLMDGATDPQVIRHWVEQNQPDGIISDDASVYETLQTLGLRVPEQCGLALTRVINNNALFSGIEPPLERIGEQAVNLLHAKILMAERGIRAEQAGLIINGFWNEGKTLPAIIRV
jgi:LacI family transcriptional regulator